MPLYKVMNANGAYIDDIYYAEGEIVELPKGVNPKWGCLCDDEGVELEDFTDKLASQDAILDQLAQAVEKNPADAEVARENAELKKQLADMQAKIDGMTTADTTETEEKTEDEDTAPSPELTEQQVATVNEAVLLLEDGNNDHWTARAEPRLDKIAEITGITVSRAQLDKINNRRRKST